MTVNRSGTDDQIAHITVPITFGGDGFFFGCLRSRSDLMLG